MLQLASLQGHRNTAPPSVMSGWLVLAFGAPIKILMLDSREKNKIEFTGLFLYNNMHSAFVKKQSIVDSKI